MSAHADGLGNVLHLCVEEPPLGEDFLSARQNVLASLLGLVNHSLRFCHCTSLEGITAITLHVYYHYHNLVKAFFVPMPRPIESA
jgi:hypothetical protein